MASSDVPRQKAAGDAFERLCMAFLKHDPEQRLQFGKVWRYGDWARDHGIAEPDDGIDLVAELADGGGFAAFQCKFYAEGTTVSRAAIDSFLAASGSADFVRRIIIDTTGRDWSRTAEDTLRRQAVPVTRLGLHSLRASPNRLVAVLG